jgi:phosphatidylglycerophosphate synthase
LTDLEDSTQKRKKEREILEIFIERPVQFLIEHNISPNVLSYLGFFCSVLTAFFLAIGSVHFPLYLAWPAPFLFFMAGAFDIFDGEVARRTGRDSPTGAFLDSNIDRISDIVVIIGLIYSQLINFNQVINYLLGFTIIFTELMISYTRSRAESEGISMKGVGLMERAERIIVLMVALIIETWVYNLGWIITGTPFILFFPIFIIIYLLTLLYTVGQRIVFSYKNLSKSSEKN